MRVVVVASSVIRANTYRLTAAPYDREHWAAMKRAKAAQLRANAAKWLKAAETLEAEAAAGNPFHESRL